MSAFSDATSLPSSFSSEGSALDRQFSIYQLVQDRSADRSSEFRRVLVGTFQGAEPQLVQRVTTNILSVGDGGDLAMQQAAYMLHSGNTDLTIRKGYIAVDGTTGKSFRIIAPYKMGKKYNLMVTELDD